MYFIGQIPFEVDMKFSQLFAAATALAIFSAPVYASSVNPEWIAATNFSGFVTNDSGPGAFAEDCVGTGNCPGTSTPDDTRSLASVSGSFDGLNYEGSASVGTGELKLSVERGEGFADGTLEGGSVKAEIHETVHFSSDLLDNGQDDTLSWSFALDGTFEDGTFVDVIALASTTGDFSRARYQYNSTGTFGVTEGTILDVTTATPSAT